MGGVRLCLDPHKPGALGGRFALPAIVGPFDAVLCSHHHDDHAAWTPALGTTRIIDGPDQIGDVTVQVRAAFHDSHSGTRMGLVRMLSLTADGLRIVHCGDLGAFDADDVAWLRGADVLLVPVGGTWTLDGAGAADLVRQVQPRWVVPMHAADPRVDLALRPSEDFLAACDLPLTRAAVFDQQTPPAAGILLLASPP